METKTAPDNVAPESSLAPVAAVYRMVSDDHLCPFGIKAVDLLERRGFEVEDHHLASHEETAAFKSEHGVETTPQVFIGGRRIGGYEALREHFGLEVPDADAVTYRPVIAVFAVTALMAAASAWSTAADLMSMRTLALFVAFSMCVLAILKLRDLRSFSNQFLTYDLLARRFVPYVYVYPFAEAFVGVGMIAGVATPVVAAVALCIGTIGAVSVAKAVYVDKRELECACVGGDSKVPLGFVSLFENLMMIGMGAYMLAR